jgi:flagellar basal body rod protein FlgG
MFDAVGKQIASRRRMDPITATAASGMRARMESLEMLANNIANAATDGFKADREFYSTYVGAEPDTEAATGPMPVIDRPWTDFRPGNVRETGNPLHVAIGSRAFLAVQTDTGPAYTRNGRLQLTPDGSLVSAEGYRIRSAGGGDLKLDTAGPVEIGKDGSIKQNGIPAGQLDLVAFDDLSVLVKRGSSYFRPSDENVKPHAASDPQVLQGKLEDSNVGTAESSVRLVSVMRQFEMLQRAVALGGEMNKRAVEELARVTG